MRIISQYTLLQAPVTGYEFPRGTMSGQRDPFGAGGKKSKGGEIMVHDYYTRTKWEYLFVDAYESEGEELGLSVGLIHGEGASEMLLQWHGRPVAEFANWLGEEGWELVSCSGHTEEQVLAFKRLKV
jgi:hypothetical protein